MALFFVRFLLTIVNILAVTPGVTRGPDREVDVDRMGVTFAVPP